MHHFAFLTVLKHGIIAVTVGHIVKTGIHETLGVKNEERQLSFH
jgi:hypothetical protein